MVAYLEKTDGNTEFHQIMDFLTRSSIYYALTLFLIPIQRVLVGIMEVSAQAKEIKALKDQVKKLKKGVKPLITHHKAWMKSVALKTRLARKTYLMKKGVQKEYVSKQGRKSVKSSKGEPSVHKDPAFV
ncbi:hypothetical protein Tco_0429491 [Tanacetum coccineum]